MVERAFRRANLPNSRLILKYLPIEGSSYDFRVGADMVHLQGHVRCRDP